MNYYMTEPEQENQLTLAPSSNIELGWQEKNKVAELCKAIVTATAIPIGGRSYIPIEGWLSISAAAGYTAATEEPQRTEDGYRVKAVLRRDSDGQIISTAYGFVGDDEPMWAKRPRHANEAMAQTRAMARVCANKFRFIPVLMKIENLATTPYEEMPAVDEYPSAVRVGPQIRRAKEADRAREAQEAPPPSPQKPDVPNGNGGDKTIARVIGIVTGCRTSQFEGKIFYWAALKGKDIFTADEVLGKALMQAEGQEIDAELKPGKTPNRFKLQNFDVQEIK
jgi:hypothetical protein